MAYRLQKNLPDLIKSRNNKPFHNNSNQPKNQTLANLEMASRFDQEVIMWFFSNCLSLLKRLRLGRLHKYACHPPGNARETKITHFLSNASALLAGTWSVYFHAWHLALPIWKWLPAVLGSIALTYLLIFPLLYLLALKPAYRLFSRLFT